MQNGIRSIAPILVLALAGLHSSGAAAGEDDALFKACPAFQAWAKAHPQHGADAAAPADAKPETASAPELRAELKQRVATDQRAQELLTQSAGRPDDRTAEAVLAVNRANLEWLKKMLAENGFPTIEQVGQDGVSDAFLLVQHADADPLLQQSVLESLRPRLETAGIRKSDFAYLTDRVLTSQEKPQRYGTQFAQGKDGSLVLKETEDMAHVDERRQQMDLMPLSAYECALRASYSSQ